MHSQPTVEAVGCEVWGNERWAGSPESWLPILVLLCDFGQVPVPLCVPLLQMDKIISEVIEDCDSMHLPQNGGYPPRGPHHPTLLLGFPGTPGGLKGWELAMPVAPPGPSSSTTGPVHCLHLTDKCPPEGEGDPSSSSASTQLNPCHPMLWALQVEGSQLA